MFPQFASAAPFSWLVDSTASSINVRLTATVSGTTLSDDDNSSVTGTLGGEVSPGGFPFGQVHLQTMNLSLSRNLRFDLTVFLLGGAIVETTNLGFGIPGPTNRGVAGPPATNSVAGSFTQTGNIVDQRGTISYRGTGIIGGQVPSGSIDLATVSPFPTDFAGTLTQTGTNLRLSFPLAVTQVFDAGGVPVTISVNGNVRANASSSFAGWNRPTDGNWSTVANWVGQVPTGGTISARLGPTNSGLRRITLDVSPRVPSLLIDSPQPYQISQGLAGQTIEFTGTNPRLTVQGTTHQINTLAGAASATEFTVDTPAATDRVSGLFSIRTGGQLTKLGQGTVEVLSLATGIDRPLRIAAGRVVTATPPGGLSVNRVGGLLFDRPAPRSAGAIVAPIGTLDLGNTGLVIDHAPGTPPGDLRELISFGFAGGSWTGTGITFNPAARPGTLLGYAPSTLVLGAGGGTWFNTPVDGSAVLVRPTLAGDTNLDALVDFGDLVELARNYNLPGEWSAGDFDYDGAVGFADLVALARNYNTSLPAVLTPDFADNFVSDWTLARSLVPEPSIALLVMSPIVLMARRRRRTKR